MNVICLQGLFRFLFLPSDEFLSISQYLSQIIIVFGLSPQVGSSVVASVKKGRTS